MVRISFCLSIGTCLLLPSALLAQRSFPSPSIQLHDVKFKAPEPLRTVAGKIVVINGRTVGLPLTPTQINSLAFSQDSKLLAAGKEYGRLIVWDVASQQVVQVIDTGFKSVGRVAISPDNQFIAAGASTGPSIKVWHISDGQLASTLENTHANVLQLIYTHDPSLLIVFSGSTDGFDTVSGKLVKSFPDERDPVLSSDGSALITMKGATIIVRNTRDWTVTRTLPRLSDYERPAFWDETRGVFLFEDQTDDHVFIAARTSDGQMVSDEKLANLPKSLLTFYDFGAIDPHTGLAFGHSAGQLWALDLKTGKTCLSPQLLSDSAALSPDGTLLAGAIEPETPTDNQKEAGVNLWKTEDLAKACHMQ